MNITIKELGTNNEITINTTTTSLDIETFVALSVNHWVACYVDNIRVWTHDMSYACVFSPEYGCYLCDKNETIRKHARILKQFIKDDFLIII